MPIYQPLSTSNISSINKVCVGDQRYIQMYQGENLVWEAPKSYASTASLAYNTTTIPASGGTATPVLDYSSSWGWYENTTGGGSLTPAYTVSYSFKTTAPSTWSIDSSTGVITATTLNNTNLAQTPVTVSALVTTSDGSETIDTTIIQAENTIVKGTLSRIQSGTVAWIPASGGTIDKFKTISVRFVGGPAWSSGYTTTNYQYITDVNDSHLSYTSVTAPNLGTTYRSALKVGTITATCTFGTDTSTKSLDVYQYANTYTIQALKTSSVYSSRSIVLGPTFEDIHLFTSGNTYVYTSGATKFVPADYDYECYEDSSEETIYEEENGWMITRTDLGEFILKQNYYFVEGSTENISTYQAYVSITLTGDRDSDDTDSEYYYITQYPDYVAGGSIRYLPAEGGTKSTTCYSWMQGMTISVIPSWLSVSVTSWPAKETFDVNNKNRFVTQVTATRNKGMLRVASLTLEGDRGSDDSILVYQYGNYICTFYIDEITIPSVVKSGDAIGNVRVVVSPSLTSYDIDTTSQWTATSSASWLRVTSRGSSWSSASLSIISEIADTQPAIITFTDSNSHSTTVTVIPKVSSTGKAILSDSYCFSISSDNNVYRTISLSDGTAITSSTPITVSYKFYDGDGFETSSKPTNFYCNLSKSTLIIRGGMTVREKTVVTLSLAGYESTTLICF